MNDRAVGSALLGGGILGVIIYGLLLVYEWEITLRVTAFLGVTLLLGILGWIGYTMATTPPPEPIAEMPEKSQSAQSLPPGPEKQG